MDRPLAAVFDLDGTLVDNMRYHGDAWLALGRRLGSPATRDDFEHRWAGKKADEIFFYLLGRAPTPEESAQLQDEKESAYRESYRPHVEPLAGLLPFLDRLRRAGRRLALATAAPEGNRDLVLGALGLQGAFEAVVGPEAAAHGKPAPDIYLGAASALGLDPSRCLAFEDAVNGVLSARAAGMEAVGVLTATDAGDLVAAGARFTIRDYTALPADLEDFLFG